MNLELAGGTGEGVMKRDACTTDLEHGKAEFIALLESWRRYVPQRTAV